MKKEETNNKAGEILNLPLEMLPALEERIADFGNNKNHYINSIVVEFLKEKGYKVEMSLPEYKKRKSPRNSNRGRASKNALISFKLTDEARDALQIEADKVTRTAPGMIKHLIDMDCKQLETA